MMILRSAAASPYVRKVRIAADLVGLGGRIETVAADTADPSDTIRTQNPLGKIPALVLEDGRVLFDSRVIVEYLDHLSGGGRLVPAGAGRFDTLTLQALADGICDAALLLRYEQVLREPEMRSAKWIENQNGKIARALAVAEANPPARADRDIGAIALACALGYLDLRFEGAWRAGHPKLVAWLAAFVAAVPSFDATKAG